MGESGCGKSTLCRAVLQLIEPTSGSIRFNGREVTEFGRRRDARRPARDADDLPGPLRVAQPAQAGRPRSSATRCACTRASSSDQRKRTVQELLEQVGLNPEHYNRFPHEFSGGQRQRIGIARALALRPKLIIADEPVSALDVSIQAQIINLLEDLQDEFGLTYVFVAHDLGVVRHVSDRIAVMYLGKIVEIGPAEEVYANPIHPYTLSLLSAIPIPDPEANRGARGAGDQGRRAEPRQSAGRLPLPHALPVRDGGLLRGRTAAGRPRRRPLGRVPPPA